MKQYPSIYSNYGEFKAYVFDKLDGSNLRFEYSRKRRWYKYGTRHRLFDESDPTFGPAKLLFLNTLAEPLTRIIKEQRWQQLVVFAEFYGPHSFAGIHNKNDSKKLTVFDVAADNKGLLSPKEFLTIIAKRIETPNFLGIHNWTSGFVKRVYNKELSGITFEGVVGKANELNPVMVKAKTKAWKDKIVNLYGEKAVDILNS